MHYKLITKLFRVTGSIYIKYSIAQRTFCSTESSSGGGESREQTVARLVTDMLEKLPQIYDEFEVKEKLRDMGLLFSMVIFLRQELDRMQRVCF